MNDRDALFDPAVIDKTNWYIEISTTSNADSCRLVVVDSGIADGSKKVSLYNGNIRVNSEVGKCDHYPHTDIGENCRLRTAR